MGGAAIPLMAAGGLMSAEGSIASSNAEKNYYSYLAGTANQSAALSLAAGESEAKTVGAEEFQQERTLNEQGRAVAGAQRAALASGGAGVGSKTAEQLSADTSRKVSLDEQALRYNADVKMKNVRVRGQMGAINEENAATGYGMAGKNAVSAAGTNAFSTILGTGGQVAKYWNPGKVT